MGSYDTEPLVDVSQKRGDWRDKLVEDGYVVIPGAVTPDRAQHYLDSLFDWLETFPYGFKKDDPDTWNPQHLPAHVKGGMYHGYSVSHERFFWEARLEPEILSAFSSVWGTDELLASFDGVNLTLPSKTDKPKPEFWPHVDQSPLRKGMQCVQGLLNLAPNGPEDGGLIVLRGSSKLNEEFFATHTTEKRTWGPADWFGFTEEEIKWFLDHGCEPVKVCVEPGDLILWDSRTVHYNKPPESDAVRSVLYMCYTPASYATSEDLEKKGKLFHQRTGTTHWPHANIFANDYQMDRLGKPETYKRTRPATEPVETPQLLKLAGAMAY